MHEEDWTALFKDKAVFCSRKAGTRPDHGRDHELSSFGNSAGGARQIQSILAPRFVRMRLFTFASRGAASSRCRWRALAAPPDHLQRPAAAREVLEQELQCEARSARFMVLGCAFFCPVLGTTPSTALFDDALLPCRLESDALPIIWQAMATPRQAGRSGEHVQQPAESAPRRPRAAAFQVICEALHGRLPGAAIQPRNTFQRLAEGSELGGRQLG